MPKFFDYHEEPVSWQDKYHTDEMAKLMKDIILNIKAGQVDESGVRYVNILLTQDGHAACIAEAADREAVQASHRALGFDITLDEIHPIADTVAEIVTVTNKRTVSV